MTDELAQLLKNLHLGHIAQILDAELTETDQAQRSPSDFLARLLRAQWHHRQETALAWRIKQAKLPQTWTLETFPFKQQPGVNARQMRTLAELDFVPKAENIVFIGGTGVGKTGLASALLLKAIQNGHRALFIRAQDLFDEEFGLPIRICGTKGVDFIDGEIIGCPIDGGGGTKDQILDPIRLHGTQ